MSDDDPVRRRAEEIRRENAASAGREKGRDHDLRTERTFLAQRFLDALTEKTSHSVECVEADARPHGALARFNYLADSRIWAQPMFEFGIDRVVEEAGIRAFRYYLEPLPAAFGIANPETGVTRPLRDASEVDVQAFGVAIAIEMMARSVAAGAVIGTPARLGAMLADNERREAFKKRRDKRDRGKKFWSGCFVAAAWCFGIFVAIGLLGSLRWSCS